MIKNYFSKLRQRLFAHTPLRNDTEGQSLVIVALMLVGILAMAGLVFDGGSAYVHRRNMQNAADSAALAGAREFILRTDNSAATEQKILAAINAYAAQNGAPSTVVAFFVDVSNNQVGAQIGLNGGVPASIVRRALYNAMPAEVGNDATGIRVVTTKTFPTLFLGAINATLGGVGARATVQTGKAGAPKGLMPIAVPRCYVDKLAQNSLCGSGTQWDKEHTILGQVNQDPVGKKDKSYRGAINFTDRKEGGAQVSTCPKGGSDVQFAVDIINNGGYNNECGPIDYGQIIDGFTGNKAGNIIDAIQDNFPIGSDILVCVYPTGGITNPGTNADVPCIGFAAMRITGYDSNEMQAIWTGSFITSGPIDNNAPSWQKVYAVQMSQ